MDQGQNNDNNRRRTRVSDDSTREGPYSTGQRPLNDQTYHSDKTTIDLITTNAITIISTINNGTNNNRLIQFNIINKIMSQILEMKFRN